MAYVIAEPCIGQKDNSCVEVCPVDCIHPTPDKADYDKVEMLYIDLVVVSLCRASGECSPPGTPRRTSCPSDPMQGSAIT